MSRRRQIAGSIVGWTKVKRKVIIQMFTSMPPLSPSNLCTTQKMCIILVSVVLCVVVDDSILYSHSTKKTTTTIDTRHTHAVKTRGERITRRMKYTYKKPVGRSHSCMWSCCSVAAGFSVTGKSNYDDNGIIREERRNIERQRQRVTRLRVCIKRNNRRMVVGGWLVSFNGCKV